MTQALACALASFQSYRRKCDCQIALSTPCISEAMHFRAYVYSNTFSYIAGYAHRRFTLLFENAVNLLYITCSEL